MTIEHRAPRAPLVGATHHMAGPVGFGVDKAVRDAGKSRRRAAPPPSAQRSWWYFFLVTLALSWLTAAALGPPAPRPEAPLLVQLFWASLYYGAVMGWQPLVGAWLARPLGRPRPDTTLRHGLRHVPLALALALGLANGAMLLARLLGEPSARAGIEPLIGPRSAGAALAALVILWTQSVGEEYGWRGQPLRCAIDRWGPRLGLIVHGLAWGAWYAPLFLVTAPTPSEFLPAAGAFAVTCLLLGIVLGWLSLRSGSILPSAIVNAALTIMAGLPLLLHGGSSGARDAIFRWPGWPLLAAVVLVLMAGKLPPWRKRPS